MGPRDERHTPQDDLFRCELVELIDPRHPLMRLEGRIDWSVWERERSELFASSTGRRAAPARMIAGLLYLQHAHEFPTDPSSLTRWRQRIGEEGVELLLADTVDVAKREGVVKRQSLERVTVDTTVEEKAIRYPTDAKLYARRIRNLTTVAQQHDGPLRQSRARKALEALLMVNRYAKARQMKRMRRMTKRLKTYHGRVTRDIERNIDGAPENIQVAFREPLHRANRLLNQIRKSKNKLLSWHAPEVEVIGTGKVAKPCEFGVKLSVAVTNKDSFVVGCRSMPNNPFDGHTLAGTLEQTEILSGVEPNCRYVDRGYKGAAIAGVQIFRSGQKRGVNTRTLKRELKRRGAVGAVIGDMKNGHRMDRCRLKGVLGDALTAVLVSAGHNVRLLLQAVVALLRQLLHRLLEIIGFGNRDRHSDSSVQVAV